MACFARPELIICSMASRQGGKLKPLKKPKKEETFQDEQDIEFKKKQAEDKKQMAAMAKKLAKK